MHIKIFSPHDEIITQQIDQFRRENPGNTSSSTAEERKIHADKYCSDQDITQWIVAMDGDVGNVVVGTAGVFARTITVNGKPANLGGIGKVRVATAQRKKGIGNQMMEVAMQQLHTNKADVAFLCTDLNSFLADWYKKYGFEVLPKPYTYTGASGKRYTEQDGMLAVIKSPDIFEKIMKSSDALDLGKGNW